MAYFAFSVGSWLRTHASLRLRQLRNDEQKHASEIQRLGRLIRLVPEFSQCGEELPDLSHLISGSLLKRYELKRKQYFELYREIFRT